MQPDIPQTQAPEAVHNPLAAMQPDERVICEIKRHPIGIFMVYAGESLLLIVLAVITVAVAPAIFGGNDPGQVRDLGLVLFFFFAVASLGYVFVATVIYWGNRWIVTSDSITQVKQTGLFHKQSSQLSFENLEDVTAEQNGVLATALRYGALRAETAGESSKFIFQFCPNPNYYAQKILAAREVFERTNSQRLAANEPQAAPQPPPVWPPATSQQPPVASQTAEQPPVYPEQAPGYQAPPETPSDNHGGQNWP